MSQVMQAKLVSSEPNKIERILSNFFAWAITVYGTSMFVQLFVGFVSILISISLARDVFQASEKYYLDQISMVLAVGVGIFFAVYLERKKLSSEDLEKYHYWLRTVVRYILAYIFFEYAFAKIFKQQFYTNLSTLDMPLSEITGLQLAWRFFGYSYAYTVFIALSQIACAILLLFPRTATLGAAMLLPIISNIFFINFTHHIPVKLEAATLLIMVMFLVISDFRRIKAVFWDHRAIAQRPFTFRQPLRKLKLIKVSIIIVLVTLAFINNLDAYRKFVATTTSLYGAWTVVDYQVNDVSRSGDTDATVWKKVYFESDQLVSVKTAGGRPQEFESETKLDLKNKSLRLIDFNTDGILIDGTYDSPSPGQLLMTGTNGKENLRITLKRD